MNQLIVPALVLMVDVHDFLSPSLPLSLSLSLSLSLPLTLSLRLYRYSMVIEDGVVKSLNVEPDGKGLTCSLSNAIFSQL